MEAVRGPRGLATLAMLKSNFDAGRDHIDLFLPFVLDTIAGYPQDDFTAENIRDAVRTEHGLGIPLEPIRTMLKRATRKSFLRREAGRYFRLEKPKQSTRVSASRPAIEAAQLALGQALQSAAAERGTGFDTPTDALLALVEFVDCYHLPLLLDDEDVGHVDLEERAPARFKAVAQFVHHALTSDSEYREALTGLIEGYVVQNVLTMRDIDVESRIKGLEVYLDTGFLLRALGLEGESEQSAARDGIELLREAGIQMGVFEDTIVEIKRILLVYEAHLATAHGVSALRQTPVTRFLLEKRYTPSDVREAISLLGSSLASLGIKSTPFPKHQLKYTLSEEELADLLKWPDQPKPDQRVWHDVNCTAAVLTMRGGRRPTRLADAVALFATTTGRLVDTVRTWYRREDDCGLLPVGHIQSLLNVIWLRRPTVGSEMKVHEMIALCEAVLRPSQKAWSLFMAQLRRDIEENKVTSEELVAIVASAVTERRLSDVEFEDDVDAATVREVIDRVRTEEGERIVAAVSEERHRWTQELERATEEMERARGHLATCLTQERRAREKAEASARTTAEQLRQAEFRDSARRGALARLIANSVFSIAVVLVLSALALSVPGVFPDAAGPLRISAYVVLGLCLLVPTALNLIFGFTLTDWKKHVRRWGATVARRVIR